MRFFLIALAALSLSGCGDMEDTEEYQSGYDAGHADGYEEGRRVGYNAGYEEGHEEGFEKGVQEGEENICDEIENRLNYGAASAVGC